MGWWDRCAGPVRKDDRQVRAKNGVPVGQTFLSAVSVADCKTAVANGQPLQPPNARTPPRLILPRKLERRRKGLGRGDSSQSGDILAMRGRGIPDPRGGRRGDQVVRVVVEVPKKLTKKQEELLRRRRPGRTGAAACRVERG